MDSSASSCCVDTVVVGSGPAALILSYILSGHHPFLRPQAVHPDPQLQNKLAALLQQAKSSGGEGRGQERPNGGVLLQGVGSGASTLAHETSAGSGGSGAGTARNGDAARRGTDKGGQADDESEGGYDLLGGFDVPILTSHFPASRLGYSTQALAINTLLDTLLKPLIDTECFLASSDGDGESSGCRDGQRSLVEWLPKGRVVSHVVLGRERDAGGQWAANLLPASGGIGALSYAELLDLPAWGLSDYLKDKEKANGRANHDETKEEGSHRPSRQDITTYLKEYPHHVGIQDRLDLGRAASGICRDGEGFYIPSHNISCRHLVLASGIFSRLIPPPPELRPLLELGSPLSKHAQSLERDLTRPERPLSLTATDAPSDIKYPTIVVGSGFSAADLILTLLSKRIPVLHLYRWNSSDPTSPLRACHPQAYPEYAAMYRRMKRSVMEAKSRGATLNGSTTNPRANMRRRKSNNAAFATLGTDLGLESEVTHKEWTELYEGFPNGRVTEAVIEDGEERHGLIKLDLGDGKVIEKRVSGLEYAVGRRGDLDYLEAGLRNEVLATDVKTFDSDDGKKTKNKEEEESMVSGRSLRAKIVEHGTEVAPDVFVVGSLVGDSLIRHAYGSCVFAAEEILARQRRGETAPAKAIWTTESKGSNATEKMEGKKAIDVKLAMANGHEHLGSPLGNTGADLTLVETTGTTTYEEEEEVKHKKRVGRCAIM